MDSGLDYTSVCQRFSKENGAPPLPRVDTRLGTSRVTKRRVSPRHQCVTRLATQVVHQAVCESEEKRKPPGGWHGMAHGLSIKPCVRASASVWHSVAHTACSPSRVSSRVSSPGATFVFQLQIKCNPSPISDMYPSSKLLNDVLQCPKPRKNAT